MNSCKPVKIYKNNRKLTLLVITNKAEFLNFREGLEWANIVRQCYLTGLIHHHSPHRDSGSEEANPGIRQHAEGTQNNLASLKLPRSILEVIRSDDVLGDGVVQVFMPARIKK